jgi:hypothetical protein
MDPDQDLLRRLDRREEFDRILPAAGWVAMAALVGTIIYLILKLDLNVTPEIATDAAALLFIGFAVLAFWDSRFG